MADKTKKQKMWYLTKEETVNVRSRQGIVQEHQYTAHLVTEDIKNYIAGQILVRLGLDPKDGYVLSDDATHLVEANKAPVPPEKTS